MIVPPFLKFGSVILCRFESSFSKRRNSSKTPLRNLLSNLLKNPLEAFVCKAILWNLWNFLRSRVYYFLPLWWSIKDEFLRNWPSILVMCALASRTVCEWSRCKSKLLWWKTVWKSEVNPWKPLEKAYVGQNHPFWTLKNSKLRRRAPGGTVVNSVKIMLEVLGSPLRLDF